MRSLSLIIQTDGGFFLLLIALLTFLGQLYISIRFFSRQKRSWSFAISLGHLCQLGLGLYLLLDGIFLWNEERTPLPGMVLWVYALPWLAVYVWELVSAILTVILGIQSFRYERDHLSESAIKDAVDLLAQGLCIIDEDQHIRLANLRIHEISRQMTGSPLTNAASFLAVLEEKAKEYGNYTAQKLFQSDNGTVYLSASREISLPDGTYTQFTISDVTQQSRILRELSIKNEKLADVQQRMREYQSQASRILMEEELLNARIAVHDGLGSLLLHCKYYLDHPDQVDEKQLLSMLEDTNRYLLQEAGESADDEDIFLEALAVANRMGIQVTIHGNVPVSPTDMSRDIIGRAIRECAANAQKHADGKNLFVRIEEMDSKLLITVTNDGTPPKDGVIWETGGLKSLRRLVESAGGSMQIDAAERFILRLTLHAGSEAGSGIPAI